jgi:hypothetical protein
MTAQHKRPGKTAIKNRKEKTSGTSQKSSILAYSSTWSTKLEKSGKQLTTKTNE